MATTKQVTAEELLALPDDGWQYELIEGVLHRMAPAGGEHGEIETEFIVHLAPYVRAHGLGKLYPGDTGFFIGDAKTVLAPDVAFVRADRLPPPAERIGFLDVIPDLVIEIASPSDDQPDIDAKIARYVEAGVPLLWAVYPRRRTVVAHRPGQEPQTFGVGDVLAADDLVPGFRLSVAETFG